ncbi:MAG: phosphate signaling complex protein PhoU [Verrucomicrobiales bacterium]|nr:phosphate signaling complex protein PhoU [Verrucomicrobiales bacterium]
MNQSNTEHILASFEEALRESRNSVLRMASVAQQNLEHAITGLLSRNSELCNQAIADDDEVNSYEKSIDGEGLKTLMRFSPVATDLRQVLAAMKIANNLERISDEAGSIARRARKIGKQAEVAETRMMEPLYEMAAELLRDGIRAYAESDVSLAMSLYELDQKLDKAHRKTIKELTKAMEQDPENLKVYLHLIFVVRCLERIGDHAVNIGEESVFVESATDIRHVGADALKEFSSE